MPTLFEHTINTVERRLEEDRTPSLAIVFGSFVCKALTFGPVGDAIQIQAPQLFADMDRAATVLDYPDWRLFDASDDLLETSVHLKTLYKTLGKIEDVLIHIENKEGKPSPPFELQLPVRIVRMQVETALCALDKKIANNFADYNNEDEIQDMDPYEHPSRPSITYITPRLVPVFQKAAMWLGAQTVQYYIPGNTRSTLLKTAKRQIEDLNCHASDLGTAGQNKARVMDTEQVFKTIHHLCDELERMERVLKVEKLRDLRHFFMAVNTWSGLFLHDPQEKADVSQDSAQVIDIRTRKRHQPNVRPQLVHSSP